MDPHALVLLRSERVCVLSVLLRDGSPHAAAMHYSHRESPLELFIQTTSTSVKYSTFLTGKAGKAAVVIGFSEERWLTLQMRGDIQVVTRREELVQIHQVHYAKHPDAEQWKDDPETAFFKFTPTWWRYTDFNTKPETIIEK